ncbi:hypothetical protein B0J13DRAFT_168908 [Dactylonectria estremocensis]|uniref:Uncharacterized protein n=1 Tax=Dactylonectria estremocensis TaxID=1079267 RepID=A0A9P9F8P2_9HYPO|nr:hypothetical protein B0J13DRAFT_168908 [Dactylonectria estremocensis]
MEESAPKRRRTSSRTSLDIAGESAAPTPVASSTSPDANAATTARRKRPSYASPTKASLAHHNPEILERRRSASPQKSPNARRALPQSLGDESVEQSPSELLALRLAKSVLESDVGRTDDAEPTPGTGRSARRAIGGMAAAARRTPSRPNPRPLPPPGSDEEEEANPFLRRGLRRSPPPGAPGLPAEPIPEPERDPESEAPEPELPPSVPDVVSSTPPRGIHSSPLRWREKSKPKSSPLKQPPARTAENPSFPKKSIPQPTFGRQRSREPVPLEETTGNARKTRVLDPNATKKKERDAILREIEELEKDLKAAQAENERIRVMQKSGRVLAPSDSDKIIDLVQRHHVTDNSRSRLTSSQQLAKMALNPIGLLPFGKPPPQPQVSAGMERDTDLDIRSHRPVTMTAEEELPYLELFCPFSLTSTISILPQVPDQPLRQEYAITLRSRDSPGMFTARINMIVNALDLTILNLKVAALEPAAKAELEPFIDKICAGACNRTMQRNVGILSWAMGEWIRVAMERAAFWCQLERSLGTKDAVLEAAGKMRTRKSKRRKDDEGDEEALLETPFTRADLIRCLGQSCLEISIPDDGGLGSALRLEWKIGFDWTGEAQIQLGAMVGVPGKWHQLDERGLLGNIPKLFAELVEGGEKPETATRTIIALLAGDVA